jgi:hypothetical protein
MAKNAATLLAKLAPQERNELLSALKHFDREKYWGRCVTELMLVDLDDIRAAARLYGSHALESAVEAFAKSSRRE